MREYDMIQWVFTSFASVVFNDLFPGKSSSPPLLLAHHHHTSNQLIIQLIIQYYTVIALDIGITYLKHIFL